MALTDILMTENEIGLFKKLINNNNQKQINVKIVDIPVPVKVKVKVNNCTQQNITVGYVYGIGYVEDNQNVVFPVQAI